MQKCCSIDDPSVLDEGIHIEPLPEDIETIVLASDGYPLSQRHVIELSHIPPKQAILGNPCLPRLAMLYYRGSSQKGAGLRSGFDTLRRSG